MHNNTTPTIPHVRPTLQRPSMPPLLLEDLTDADDISRYVQQMFSHKEYEFCDVDTD